MLVIDASVTVDWLLNEGRASDAEAVLGRAADEEIWVPALFWIEVANVLKTRIRRRKLDPKNRDLLLMKLGAVGLRTDAASSISGAALDRVIALSDRFDLTAYDACYLELALRVGADLATFDGPLAEAAAMAAPPEGLRR